MDERLKQLIKLAKANNNNNQNKGFAEIDIYDNMTFDYDGKPMQVKQVNVVLESAKNNGLMYSFLSL